MGYCVIVRVTTNEGTEDQVAEAYEWLAAGSRSEPGVIDWRVFRSADKPREFLLYELYHDESGLEAHRATEHFQRYQREVLPLIESREPSFWLSHAPA